MRALAVRVAALLVCLAVLWGDPGQAQETPAESAQREFLLEADTLIYDLEAGRVVARGNVELIHRGYVLKARELTYDRRRDLVLAEGQVVLVAPDGAALFAERFELTGDLREGFVRHVGARLDDEVRIAANAATHRRGRYTVFEKAVYSPCPITCENGNGEPFWQVRAKRVVHDRKARTIVYQHAVLELLGVPVAYTPYFSHPDPTVEKRTGFLAPTVGTDSELGFTLETPFFIDLAPNRDLTLAPRITTRQGPMLRVEVRDLERFGRTDLGGSVAYAEEHARRPSEERKRELRGHIEGRGRYHRGETDRYGFEVALASDNTYLDTFDLSDEDVLLNRAFYERHDGTVFGSAELVGFQGLRETDEQDRIPFALPLLEFARRGGPMAFGSFWTVDLGLMSLFRTEGLDTQRLTGETGIELPRIGPLGDLWRLRLALRGDVYVTDGDPATARGGSRDVAARLLPHASLDWSWPLVGETGSWSHLVEPTAALMWDREGGNDPDIPNEDSVSFEFDETNLFRTSRFTGLDRVEEGLRLAYGVRATSVGAGGFRVGGVLGQLIQLDAGEPFPQNVGLDGSYSDLVGRLEVRPGPYLDLGYRFRFDAAEAAFRRNDVAAVFGPPRLRFRLHYIELGDEGRSESGATREQIVAGVRLRATDELSLGAESRYDIDETRQISNSFGLVYRNPCFTLTAGLERRFTSKGELEDETTFKLRIELATLGDLGASSSIAD